MSVDLKFDIQTQHEIQEAVSQILSRLPEQLGIDESIPGCEVISMDTYSVGVGVLPRYITVALRGGPQMPVFYRGGISGLGVGDDVLVMHFRDGDRYEVTGPGGATGSNIIDIHDHSDNTQGGANLHDIEELELADPTTLTIAGGIVTRSQAYHTIDTEGGAATDNLDTINGGAVGDILVIKPESGARTIVIKHNTGNIWILGAADVTLDDADDHILLVYDGTYWCSVGDGAGAGHDPVTLGVGSDPALSLLGQELTLADVLTPAKHTAIGDAAPHHAAVTLDATAAVLLDIVGQLLSFDTQAANTVLAGPVSGADDAPAFRALAVADIPAKDGAGAGEIPKLSTGGDLRFAGGLSVGSATNNPDNGMIWATGDIRTSHGLAVGSIVALDPPAGEIHTTSHARIRGGLRVGSLDAPAGDGQISAQVASIAGHLAVGTNAIVSATRAIAVDEEYTNHGGDGIFSRLKLVATVNGAYGGNAIFAQAAPIVNTAITNTGQALGFLMQALRNIGAADDGGTLATLKGAEIGYGHYNATASTPVTTTAYGVSIMQYYRTGTITTAYDIYINAGSGGGAVGTRYGIYISAIANADTNYAIYSAGGASYHAGNFSVGGTAAAAAQLHVDNPGATAQPVLLLDQGDVSEEMIEFVTTIGVGNAIEAVGGKTLTTTHFIKVKLPGSLIRYIPCGTIA